MATDEVLTAMGRSASDLDLPGPSSTAPAGCAAPMACKFISSTGRSTASLARQDCPPASSST